MSQQEKPSLNGFDPRIRLEIERAQMEDADRPLTDPLRQYRAAHLEALINGEIPIEDYRERTQTSHPSWRENAVPILSDGIPTQPTPDDNLGTVFNWEVYRPLTEYVATHSPEIPQFIGRSLAADPSRIVTYFDSFYAITDTLGNNASGFKQGARHLRTKVIRAVEQGGAEMNRFYFAKLVETQRELAVAQERLGAHVGESPRELDPYIRRVLAVQKELSELQAQRYQYLADTFSGISEDSTVGRSKSAIVRGVLEDVHTREEFAQFLVDVGVVGLTTTDEAVRQEIIDFLRFKSPLLPENHPKARLFFEGLFTLDNDDLLGQYYDIFQATKTLLMDRDSDDREDYAFLVDRHRLVMCLWDTHPIHIHEEIAQIQIMQRRIRDVKERARFDSHIASLTDLANKNRIYDPSKRRRQSVLKRLDQALDLYKDGPEEATIDIGESKRERKTHFPTYILYSRRPLRILINKAYASRHASNEKGIVMFDFPNGLTFGTRHSLETISQEAYIQTRKGLELTTPDEPQNSVLTDSRELKTIFEYLRPVGINSSTPDELERSTRTALDELAVARDLYHPNGYEVDISTRPDTQEPLGKLGISTLVIKPGHKPRPSDKPGKTVDLADYSQTVGFLTIGNYQIPFGISKTGDVTMFDGTTLDLSKEAQAFWRNILASYRRRMLCEPATLSKKKDKVATNGHSRKPRKHHPRTLPYPSHKPSEQQIKIALEDYGVDLEAENALRGEEECKITYVRDEENTGVYDTRPMKLHIHMNGSSQREQVVFSNSEILVF